MLLFFIVQNYCNFILPSVQPSEFWLNNCLRCSFNKWGTSGVMHTSLHPWNNSLVGSPLTWARVRNIVTEFCPEVPAIHNSLIHTYLRDLLMATCKPCFNLSSDFIFLQITHRQTQLSKINVWTLAFYNLASRRHNLIGIRHGVICH